ncbi:hypothetical protein PRNP1_001970 [Phytophthora ramorum]
MATATMDLRDAQAVAAKTMTPDENRRSSTATVDADDDLEASFELDMGVEAVAQLLAIKAVELTQLQRTHDEYVKSSCEYERELEIEVDRYEKKMQQLESSALQLERDKSDLHSSVTGVRADLQIAHRREHMLQTQLEEMKWKIQRLEQANDELETSARIAQATIEDLQHKSESLLEQNVFLQHEKEELLKQLSSIIIAESSLSKAQQSALCKSKSCQEMIGAVDDLDIPRCESAFDKKNVTLQASLDKFVSSCDATTSTPSPIKRRKSFESSSAGSDATPKNRRYQNVASTVRFGTSQQLAVLLVVGMLSLVLP